MVETFSKLERRINFALIAIGVLYVLSTFAVGGHWGTLFELLQGGFGAALVGALADSYAVYGLFHRLGPHTDLIRKKRKELTQKVLQFVDSVLLEPEFLKGELKGLNLEGKLKELTESGEFVSLLKRELSAAVERKMAEFLQEGYEIGPLKSVVRGLAEGIGEKIVETVVSVLAEDKTFREIIAAALTEYIVQTLENNRRELLKLVEKRLNSIPEEEFVRALKRASWEELQYIRLNGALLGFFIGVLLKGFELLVLR